MNQEQSGTIGVRMEEPVSLLDVAGLVWRHRLIVAAAAILTAGATFSATFLMTPKYRAEVVVVPVSADVAGGGMASLVRGLGGLASLAGLGMNGGSNRDETLEYLRSRSFTTDFIRDNDLLPVLFHEHWDAAANRWTVPKDEIPTLGDAYELFSEKVRAITDDRKTGIVRISIRWSNPELAASWANALVARANARLRERAIREAQRSIEFLRREEQATTFVAVREAIAKLTEEQVKSIMLANVREEFALKTIDSATAPESDEIVWPRRALMSAVGLIVGFCIGLLLAFIRERPVKAR